jgi:hypothetical protein
MGNQQLLDLDLEFTIENWRAEMEATAHELADLVGHSRKNKKEINRLHWDIGDLLLHGKENGISDAQLEVEVDAIFHKEMCQTLIWDYIRVAKRFRDHSRRREALWWSHHKEVAIKEFDDATQDRLLDDAAKRGLSVDRLREGAKAEKKRAQKLLLGDNKVKVKTVSIRLAGDNLKRFKKLAYARKHRTCDSLLNEIVWEYLRKNSDRITKEIEAWEAPIREAKRESRKIRQVDEAGLEVLRVERKKFEDYFLDLRSRTGQPVPDLLKKYMERVCGHARWLEIPLDVLENVVTEIKEAGDDPHDQVKRLQALSWSEPQRLEITTA